MILRLLILALTCTMSVSAIQENKEIVSGVELIPKDKYCVDCNNCRQSPSAAQLLQTVQAVLNNQILLSPVLQTQLIQQLQQLITVGGIGVAGPAGATGATGPQGPAGGVVDFADFYALMPPDNAATVAPGADVDFPNNGPSSGTGLIARTGADTFNLSAIGVYQVLFQVSVNEAGQLVLTLNSGELPYTVVGRATGTSQIVGMALVVTTAPNSILTVRNPVSETAALTITPLGGGTEPVSAHLVITQIR